MKNNINTKEYWENRFKSGNWNDNGRFQTKKYAEANVKYLNIDNGFNGTILDFGCALGDAIPIYLEAFKSAKIIGYDISESAIKNCQERFGDRANFISGEMSNICNCNLIIASHVMEHLTDDKKIIKQLLNKCEDLYVFVPYKETPLYHEHVNFYTEDYYYDLNVVNKKVFIVDYIVKLSLLEIFKNILRLNPEFVLKFRKEIIMFHFKKA
jgi:trans-aconitate methyltransferase